MCGFKVILLGNAKAGKTSILLCAVLGTPNQPCESTLDFSARDIVVNVDSQCVTLNVWDTAGQELYRSIVPLYARQSSAAIIVYDIADVSSFRALGTWVGVLRQADVDAAIYIAANKTDLRDENKAVVDDRDGLLYAEEIGAKFFAVSAKDGRGVRELFRQIGADLHTQRRKALMPLPVAADFRPNRRCC
jgi:small GTP-binding protein